MNRITITLFFITLWISLFAISCNNSSDPDPCETVACFNGGSCADGECVCPEGFTGSSCNLQVTPDLIKISKIIVTDFPATMENGNSWDVSSGPDIYVIVYKGDKIIWKSDVYYEDASPSNNYDFKPDSRIEITEPNQEYTISIYDYDQTGSDFMGGIKFVPYYKDNKFPETLTLNPSGSKVAFELPLSYVW